MVRIFAPVFSALALSSAVLAAPMRPHHLAPVKYSYGYNSEPDSYNYNSEPASAVMSEPTSTKMHETPKGNNAMTTPTMAHEASTTTAMREMTTTSTSAAPTQTAPAYGSGYSNWGTDLNSCVQMCQARFGGMSPPAASAPPTTTAPSAAPAPSGTGVVHTVIVAPVKGVLRYVPFAVNASVGDTVRFMWGAGPHTVTKSSALTVCNKSADASTFASGQQNASFVFDQVVNNTEPTFFFCGVPTHCQKGMFGIINPPSAAGAATSVGQMMSTWTSQNPDIAKMRTAVDAMTRNTTAFNWASNLDVATIPTEAHQALVENVFFTRMFYAANAGAADGASRPDGQPLTIPNDVNTLLSNTNPGNAPSGATPSSTPSTTGTPAAVSATPASASVNGANGVVASSALIVVVAIFSSLFLL